MGPTALSLWFGTCGLGLEYSGKNSSPYPYTIASDTRCYPLCAPLAYVSPGVSIIKFLRKPPWTRRVWYQRSNGRSLQRFSTYHVAQSQVWFISNSPHLPRNLTYIMGLMVRISPPWSVRRKHTILSLYGVERQWRLAYLATENPCGWHVPLLILSIWDLISKIRCSRTHFQHEIHFSWWESIGLRTWNRNSQQRFSKVKQHKIILLR